MFGLATKKYVQEQADALQADYRERLNWKQDEINALVKLVDVQRQSLQALMDYFDVEFKELPAKKVIQRKGSGEQR